MERGLAYQQQGDEVAGDDEEDVDAHEAARQPPDSGMVADHEEHGDGTETLDVASVLPSRPHAASLLGPGMAGHGSAVPVDPGTMSRTGARCQVSRARRSR